MALIQPARPEPDEPAPGRGRKAARYAVPAAVAGIAAATISLVPALADTGDPSLPSITTEQLLTKIAASDTQTVDGSVKVTTDLGLPDALTGSSAGSLLGGTAATGSGASGSDSPAAPQTQLTQLLVGTHQLHVSADGQDQQKVSIIEPAAEYSIIHNGTQVWGYDSKSNQAYHTTVTQQSAASGDQAPGDVPTTPQAAAQQALQAADGTAELTVDGTARVAGRSAYELLITPQGADSTTVGSIRIAVDSSTGVPLKFTLTPESGGKAVFDIGFTKVSFAKPAADTFTYKPAKGVKVTEGGTDAADSKTAADSAQPTVLGKGWDSIAVIKTGLGTSGAATDNQDGNGVQSLLNSFGTKVSGSYGSGTVFSTRLVNALLTDSGTLYVGAVTQSALTDAANAAAK